MTFMRKDDLEAMVKVAAEDEREAIIEYLRGTDLPRAAAWEIRWDYDADPVALEAVLHYVAEQIKRGEHHKT